MAAAMPSHLTRVVFRSIIANKPLLYRGCLYRTLGPRIVFQNTTRFLDAAPQRRNFINLSFLKPKRKAQKPEVPPGLEALADVSRALRLSEQPPPPDDVAKGFVKFFRLKDMRYEDSHINIAALAFRYLQTIERPDGSPWISSETIVKAFEALESTPATGGEVHLAFVRTLRDELARRAEAARQKGEDVSPKQSPDQPTVLAALCRHGASAEARELAIAQSTAIASPTPEQRQELQTLWNKILRGFAREDNVEELLKTANRIQDLSMLSVRMQNTLVSFFTQAGQLEQAKHWYAQPVYTEHAEEAKPSSSTHSLILKACAKGGDMSYGKQVVAALLEKMPNKRAWDAIFVWSTAIGKGVDEIDRMMNVMVRRNDEERAKDPAVPILRPDIDTINDLVEFSISKRDPYLAERYIALGEKRGIQPNARTFTMQTQYRLDAGDIDGAKTAYYGLQGVKDSASVAVINRLIVAMCKHKTQQFDDIMVIVDDLHEQKAWFEPMTVAVLCNQHIRRGELNDAVDLLQLHANYYSGEQRLVIRDYLVAFLLDRSNSTADCWDTYQILRQLFPETPRDQRIQIMNEFFERKRADMGCHVFFHMRNHDVDSIRANRDVYIAAFTGFARNADAESLELAHNQLKLDMTVDLDTRMRNALMLAYAAVGKNIKALEFWTEIVASREGPTYNSICIAFRACEGMPWGDQHAKPIWKRLLQMGMDIDRRVFTAYLSAIAANFLHEESVKMVEGVEEALGFAPDMYMLSNWFNATTHIANQSKVEAWIREHHPDIWNEMETLGHTVTMDGFGYRQYNINRDLDP